VRSSTVGTSAVTRSSGPRPPTTYSTIADPVKEHRLRDTRCGRLARWRGTCSDRRRAAVGVALTVGVPPEAGGLGDSHAELTSNIPTNAAAANKANKKLARTISGAQRQASDWRSSAALAGSGSVTTPLSSEPDGGEDTGTCSGFPSVGCNGVLLSRSSPGASARPSG
jgi:hypothetical protein